MQQAKGIIRFFVIALIVVCIYHLLFTFIANHYDSQADEYARQVAWNGTEAPGDLYDGDRSGPEYIEFVDSLNKEFQSERRRFIDDSLGGKALLNLLVKKYTYDEIKAHQINLGLDLRGGMSLVLEVSVKDLIITLSGNSNDPDFLAALQRADELKKQSEANYVDLFGTAWEEVAPDKQLAAIFAVVSENQGRVSFDDDNATVLDALKTVAKDKVSSTFTILQDRIDQFGVTQANIQKQEGTGRIIVELPGIDDPQRARKMLKSTAKLEFWETHLNGNDFYRYFVQANEKVRAQMGYVEEDTTATDTTDMAGADTLMTGMSDTTGIASTDTDTSGTTTEADTGDIDLTDLEGLLQDNQGDDEAGPSTAATADTNEFPLFGGGNSWLLPAIFEGQNQQIQYVQGSTVGFARGEDRSKVDEWLKKPEVKAIFPSNVVFFWTNEANENGYYGLHAIKTRLGSNEAPLEGGVIDDATAQPDPNTGQYYINMRMDPKGANEWANLTGNNINRPIAIVLDDKVYSAPVVEDKISGGVSRISGDFSAQEAQDLAAIIEAGELPVSLDVVQDEFVGASLGEESVRAGISSLIMGIIIVLGFMILYYAGAGLVADLVLFLNMFFIMGVLASFHASLTLPGMAGILLTIGMAVDANVIIFERIKEELAKGKGLRLAIADGYQSSYSAIIDANITTLITGFILLQFGVATPVKGFATILIIGIFTSFLTAVLVSRLLIDRWMGSGKERKIGFTTPVSRKLFNNIDLKFVDKRKISYVLSTILIIVSLASIFIRGFDLGVDFKGGRRYQIAFDQAVSTTDVSDKLETIYEGERPKVKTYGNSESNLEITTSYLLNDTDADSLVLRTTYEGVSEFFAHGAPPYQVFVDNNLQQSFKVDSTIADDLQRGSLVAGGLAFLGIFLYLLFRFRKWQFGVGAIAATVHDTIILLGLFSLFKGLGFFPSEINEVFIAALLTVIGYSINDTVVVFDRVREFLGLHPTTGLKRVVDMAISSTLSRTVMTSLTTLLVVLILAIFGGQAISGFAIALLIGIMVGTYSSIFVATPIVTDLLKENPNKKTTAKKK